MVASEDIGRQLLTYGERYTLVYNVLLADLIIKKELVLWISIVHLESLLQIANIMLFESEKLVPPNK